MAFGFVRKKKASVMWKRERDVIIVAPEMMPILKVAVLWNLIPDGRRCLCVEILGLCLWRKFV